MKRKKHAENKRKKVKRFRIDKRLDWEYTEEE